MRLRNTQEAGKVLTHQQLREFLHYDPESGKLSWLSHPGGNYIKPGAATGNTPSDPHRRISIFGRSYLVHRVIWYWVKGAWPPGKIDHKDRDSTNNRWINLRPANSRQNNANVGKKRQNKSGLKGVIRVSPTRWCAQISKNYRSTHIGTFDCPAAAHLAYLVEADKEFGEFA